jgi:hypothetical protein
MTDDEIITFLKSEIEIIFKITVDGVSYFYDEN